MINYEDIDNGIVPLVRFLNDIGFETDYSCSGMIDDHDDSRNLGNGYISFLPLPPEKEEVLKRIALSSHMSFMESGECETISVEDGKMVSTPDFRNSCGIYNIVSESEIKSDIPITRDLIDIIVKDTWGILFKNLKAYNIDGN